MLRSLHSGKGSFSSLNDPLRAESHYQHTLCLALKILEPTLQHCPELICPSQLILSDADTLCQSVTVTWPTHIQNGAPVWHLEKGMKDTGVNMPVATYIDWLKSPKLCNTSKLQCQLWIIRSRGFCCLLVYFSPRICHIADGQPDNSSAHSTVMCKVGK